MGDEWERERGWYDYHGESMCEAAALLTAATVCTFTSTDPSELEACAFKNDQTLTTARLGDSIEVVGEQAFAYCRNLRTIVLPRMLLSLRPMALKATAIESIQLPPSLLFILHSCFALCGNLTTIDMSHCSLTLGAAAFKGCVSLERAVLPKDLRDIPDRCFQGCVSLLEIAIRAPCEIIGESAFEGCRALTSVGGAQCVSTIQRRAFAGCFQLQWGRFPPCLWVIGSDAFKDCRSMTVLDLCWVRTICPGAFSGCSGVKVAICDWFGNTPERWDVNAVDEAIRATKMGFVDVFTSQALRLVVTTPPIIEYAETMLELSDTVVLVDEMQVEDLYYKPVSAVHSCLSLSMKKWVVHLLLINNRLRTASHVPALPVEMVYIILRFVELYNLGA